MGVMAQAAPERDQLWRLRWLYVAGGAVNLAAVVYLALAFGTGWTWGLLWWGLLNGALPVAALKVAFARFGRRTHVSSRWHRRRVLYSCMWLWAGLVSGVLAAAFDVLWIDLGVTAYEVLCGAAVAVLIPIKRRSMRA